MIRATIATALLALLACAPAASASSGPPQAKQIALNGFFNGDAGNFDGVGNSYAADHLPERGPVPLDGITYDFPGPASGGVVALGQKIPVPPDHYATAYWLTAATYGPAGGVTTFTYSDGTQSSTPLRASDWTLNGGNGVISTPRTGSDSPALMFGIASPVDPTRVLTSITLPKTALPAPNTASLHLFALTLQPVVTTAAPAIVDAHDTNTPLADGSEAVDVTVQNLGLEWITPQNPLSVSVTGPGIETTAPARVTQLAPVEQTRVEVGIRPDASIVPDEPVNVQIAAHTRSGAEDTANLVLTPAIAQYAPTDESIATHQTPAWFDAAKFGIFIHWGAYSVPAWAPSGSAYAEWYWYWLNQAGNPVRAHHDQTYGPNVTYDDFLAQWSPARFDPVQWVKLIQDSGAKYFVFTAKHHDGIALFDDTSNGRNTVALAPHQDFLKQLFDAAAQVTPGLKRGVYYSLPEWYNPDYPMPWDRFGLGAPVNPFSGAPVPYTGYSRVGDYVADYQVPQLNELISEYQPDILWCDIGGPNDSLSVIANYYNQSLANGSPVAVNDRCGVNEHDFFTSEYSKYATFSAAKWEETRGLDPYSYGYNSATPDSAYASSSDLIEELVDVVANNGNLLLGIGPRADGSIPSVMADRLRDIGAWLNINGQSIYGTTYWSRAQQEQTGNEDLRFTVAPNRALYAIDLHAPGSQEVIESPVPIRAGDAITLLGYKASPLHWSKRADGAIVIDVPPDAPASGRYAWTFKITWQG